MFLDRLTDIQKTSGPSIEMGAMCAQELLHQQTSRWMICSGNDEIDLAELASEDFELDLFTKSLASLFKAIVSSESAVLRVAARSRRVEPFLAPTRLGNRVVSCCKQAKRQWRNVSRSHRFRPDLRLMMAAVHRWGPVIEIGFPSIDGGTVDPAAIGAIERLVRFVREFGRSLRFRNLVQDHLRGENANFASACRYIRQEFEACSCLLVLRLDLYFRPEAKEYGFAAEAAHQLHLYLRSLREDPVVDDYIGFLIKREVSFRRGMHAHLLILIDGHRHRNGYYLTKLLGERWLKRIGWHRGSFFNCYAKRHRYRYNGLGQVRLGDVRKLIGVRLALWYMTKETCVFKPGGGKVKNFWRSQTKAVESLKRGARRRPGNDMKTVMSTLDGRREQPISRYEELLLPSYPVPAENQE